LPGLVGSDYVVAACSELERRVLIEKYGGVELLEERAADGSTVVGVAAVRWATDFHVGIRVGLPTNRVRLILAEARRKVARALEWR
jgi:hypothetical protein